MNPHNHHFSDTELEQALGHFRNSVKSWSEAASVRVQTQKTKKSEVPSWFRWWLPLGAAGATVAVCALAATIFTGTHRSNLPLANQLSPQSAIQAAVANPPSASPTAQARQAASTVATTKPPVAAPVSLPARQADDPDEQLLAAIDSDISQRTPTALAPMANWMGDSANQ